MHWIEAGILNIGRELGPGGWEKCLDTNPGVEFVVLVAVLPEGKIPKPVGLLSV